MSDMADFIEWRNGDKPFNDDEDSIFEDEVYCKYCGETNLHWTPFKNHWYLFNSKGKRHQCKRDAIDVFKEVM
jgi:hypothetical protein